mmetsp:Transcript_106787/g.331735  ORF Transcript_106787/g.331735 Transcript_106787/m.331735 type:complete len:213 (+) Transcript_106787:1403-2041(+)
MDNEDQALHGLRQIVVVCIFQLIWARRHRSRAPPDRNGCLGACASHGLLHGRPLRLLPLFRLAFSRRWIGHHGVSRVGARAHEKGERAQGVLILLILRLQRLEAHIVVAPVHRHEQRPSLLAAPEALEGGLDLLRVLFFVGHPFTAAAMEPGAAYDAALRLVPVDGPQEAALEVHVVAPAVHGHRPGGAPLQGLLQPPVVPLTEGYPAAAAP